MAQTRNKKKKKETKLNKFDNKINSLIDSLIPAIMLLVPIIFILYVLNIHGYLFPKGSTLFLSICIIYFSWYLYL